MLTGKRFRMTRDTLAIDSSGEKRTAVAVPTGEIVEVIRGPRPDDTRMVDVEWNGRILVMFAEDVEGRGQLVGGGTASV